VPAAKPDGQALRATRLDGRWDRVAIALFVGALLLGLTRFVRLGEWSLWIDEALSLSDALHGDAPINPLGYWLIGLCARAADGRPDEWLLRILPACFGYATIPLCAWAFRPVAGGRASAAAALVLAASSWHLYWSQNARFYTLAALLVLLGTGLVLRGFAKGRGALAIFGLAVAATSALAHPTALLVPIGIILAAPTLMALRVGLHRRVTWAVAAVGGLALLLGLGWLGDLVDRWQSLRGSGNPAHFVLTAGYHITPTLAAAFSLGLAWAIHRRHRGMFLAAAVAIIGFGAAFGTSIAARMTAQYAFALLPFIALVAVAPFASRDPLAPALAKPARTDWGAATTGWFSAALLVLALVPALVSTVLYLTVRHGERPRWREAYAHVFENRRPGDIVFGMAAPIGEYYLTARRSQVREPVELVYLDRFRADVPERWDRRGRRAWFVLNEEELYDWSPTQRAKMRRILREDCRLVARFPLEVESRDLSVWVYVRE